MNDQLAKATALLRDPAGKPTPVYQAYLKYQAAYQDARAQHDEAWAKVAQDPKQLQTWPVTGLKYRRKMDVAYNNWVALGHKSEVEAALALLKGGTGQPPPESK